MLFRVAKRQEWKNGRKQEILLLTCQSQANQRIGTLCNQTAYGRYEQKKMAMDMSEN